MSAKNFLGEFDGEIVKTEVKYSSSKKNGRYAHSQLSKEAIVLFFVRYQFKQWIGILGEVEGVSRLARENVLVGGG